MSKKKPAEIAADTETKQPKARMTALEAALARRAEYPERLFPPGLLRFADLQASGIVKNLTQLKFLITDEGFPRGRWLSPNVHTWTDEEITKWHDNRPAERPARAKKKKGTDAMITITTLAMLLAQQDMRRPPPPPRDLQHPTQREMSDPTWRPWLKPEWCLDAEGRRFRCLR
jgi:hypothetical protein